MDRRRPDEEKRTQHGDKGEQDEIKRVRNTEYGLRGRKEGDQERTRRVRSGRKENWMRRVPSRVN
ncbi:MAG: hypothetical protein M0P17_07720 [Methanoculleus sp.]|nr:hypothetical protein [Methanoculleus sp.]